MHINFLAVAIVFLASFGATAVLEESGILNEQSLNPQLTTVPLAVRDLPTGTCNSGTPCANGACCSKNNLCGYSKDFCGDGCQHNCECPHPVAVRPGLTTDPQAMRKLNADLMLLKASKSALLTSVVLNSATAALPRSSASGKIRMILYTPLVTPSTVDAAT